MGINIRYTYGIPGKPETYFSKVFTLDQIEAGDQFDEISDSPPLKSYRIIARDLYTGLTDKNGVEIFENDKVIHNGLVYEIHWNNDGHFVAWHFDGNKMIELGTSDAFAMNCKLCLFE